MADTLADTIKQIRLKAGDTPAATAAKVGVSRPGYLKWEQGDTKNMKLGNLLSFCDAYDVNVESLIRGIFVIDADLVSGDVKQSPSRMVRTGSEYQTAQSINAFEVAEPNPDIRTLIEGYTHADEGLRRAMLTLARESIAVFEERREKNS